MKIYNVSGYDRMIAFKAASVAYVGASAYRVEFIQIKNGWLAVNSALGTFYGESKEDALTTIKASLSK